MRKVILILIISIIGFAGCTVDEMGVTINPDYDIYGWGYWLTFENTYSVYRHIRYYKRENKEYQVFDLYPGEEDTVWGISHFKSSVIDYEVYDAPGKYDQPLYTGSVEMTKEEYEKTIYITE